MRCAGRRPPAPPAPRAEPYDPQRTLAEQLLDAADRPGPDLAAPAFLVARVEYPRLDPVPTSIGSTRWAMQASLRIAADPGHDAPLEARIDASTATCSASSTFKGNRDQYEDPRNSCLNEVLDRRTGIPISLCLVYIEVARRAGIRAEGVNFPGHFLVRALQDLHTDDPDDGLIVDPFHGGAILNEQDCRTLLRHQWATTRRGSRSCWRARRGDRSSCACCSTSSGST